jgi:hypothetical protein
MLENTPGAADERRRDDRIARQSHQIATREPEVPVTGKLEKGKEKRNGSKPKARFARNPE